MFVPAEAYYCWEVEADAGWKYKILLYRNIKMYMDTTEFNLAEHITASVRGYSKQNIHVLTFFKLNSS